MNAFKGKSQMDFVTARNGFLKLWIKIRKMWQFWAKNTQMEQKIKEDNKALEPGHKVYIIWPKHKISVFKFGFLFYFPEKVRKNS